MDTRATFEFCAEEFQSVVHGLMMGLAIQNGMTALHHAARHGQTKFLEVLLIKGASIDATDKV